MFPPAGHAFDEQLRAKLLLDCEAVLSEDPADFTPALNEAEGILLQMMRPANLNGNDGSNAFLAVERGFESACIALEARGVQRPDELTLYAFYSRLRHYAGKPEPVAG